MRKVKLPVIIMEIRRPGKKSKRGMRLKRTGV